MEQEHLEQKKHRLRRTLPLCSTTGFLAVFPSCGDLVAICCKLLWIAVRLSSRAGLAIRRFRAVKSGGPGDLVSRAVEKLGVLVN